MKWKHQGLRYLQSEPQEGDIEHLWSQVRVEIEEPEWNKQLVQGIRTPQRVIITIAHVLPSY